MSDPVSNAEIEDVLSSIRRLVSENATPEFGPVATGGATEADKHAASGLAAHDFNDKLVLTPAFRVHETTDPIGVHHEQAPDVSGSDEGEDADLLSDERQAEPTAHTLHLTDPLSVIKEDDGVEETASSDEEVAPVSDAIFSHHGGTEAPIGDPDGETEAAPQDMTFSEELDELQSAPEGAADASATAPEGLSERAEAVENSSESEVREEPDQQEQHVQTLDHRVAELEAAVNESAVEFEPDFGDAVEDLGPGIFLRRRAEVETAQGEAHGLSDAAQAEDRPDQSWEAFDAEVEAFVSGSDEFEGQAQSIDPTEERPEDAILKDEDEIDFLDEDMLREMVARLVREELQGAVGEKITRNVRRLVRREVERALTLKSLE